MSISELMSMPEEDKKVIFEHILQQANKEQRKMVINQEYIQQHLNRQNGIKLRALEINNFLSDVEVCNDWSNINRCQVAPDYLNIEITPHSVDLSYTDFDGYPDNWNIPLALFDYDDENLIQYAHLYAADNELKYRSNSEKEIRHLANELGYRLVPIENTGE